MSDNIIHVSDDSFEQEVLQSEKPVLIDYWAEWCGPCKQLTPILEKVVSKYQDKLLLAKINIDENQQDPNDKNNQMSYKIISKFIKDISFEIPNTQTFIMIEKEILNYNLIYI